jgi:hypothetical protein
VARSPESKQTTRCQHQLQSGGFNYALLPESVQPLHLSIKKLQRTTCCQNPAEIQQSSVHTSTLAQQPPQRHPTPLSVTKTVAHALCSRMSSSCSRQSHSRMPHSGVQLTVVATPRTTNRTLHILAQLIHSTTPLGPNHRKQFTYGRTTDALLPCLNPTPPTSHAPIKPLWACCCRLTAADVLHTGLLSLHR